MRLDIVRWGRSEEDWVVPIVTAKRSVSPEEEQKLLAESSSAQDVHVEIDSMVKEREPVAHFDEECDLRRATRSLRHRETRQKNSD